MSYTKIISDLKQKKYAPIYFLMGEEPYFIDKISDYIEKNVLQEHEKDFNLTVFYGKDSTEENIIATAKRFPMMAEKQVVIVKEAQQLKDIQLFENYVKSPQASTILVFCHKYKKIDGRKSVGKILKKTSVMFTSSKLRDYELPDWIKKIVSVNKMVINPKNTLLLAEYLGADLAKIEGQIEKLKVILPVGSEITTEVIEKNIGISKEYNIFELQSALAKKDVLKAVKITNYFAKNPKSNPMVMTISGLYSYFSKVLGVHVSSNKGNDNAVAKEIGVHPFFVKEYNLATRNYSPGKLVKIIGYLRDYDLKSKGVNNNATYTPHSELMKELMFKIIH